MTTVGHEARASAIACPECESPLLRPSGGCMVCAACGFSPCAG